MRFEDVLKVRPKGQPLYDENNDPIAEEDAEFVDFSKCFVSFNAAAQKIRLNDGSEYVYSFYVIAPLKKSLYPLIPKEGDYVRIMKADGTIDKVMVVRGFVTYKQRYLKIWL